MFIIHLTSLSHIMLTVVHSILNMETVKLKQKQYNHSNSNIFIYEWQQVTVKHSFDNLLTICLFEWHNLSAVLNCFCITKVVFTSCLFLLHHHIHKIVSYSLFKTCNYLQFVKLSSFKCYSPAPIESQYGITWWNHWWWPIQSCISLISTVILLW